MLLPECKSSYICPVHSHLKMVHGAGGQGNQISYHASTDSHSCSAIMQAFTKVAHILRWMCKTVACMSMQRRSGAICDRANGLCWPTAWQPLWKGILQQLARTEGRIVDWRCFVLLPPKWESKEKHVTITQWSEVATFCYLINRGRKVASGDFISNELLSCASIFFLSKFSFNNTSLLLKKIKPQNETKVSSFLYEFYPLFASCQRVGTAAFTPGYCCLKGFYCS